MKRIVLVNGVPASGKSAVAAALSTETGWPLFALDTLKEALFAHLKTGDRAHNRLLGQASYQAIFAIIGDFPAATVIVDAWFGFQPLDVLKDHLARASADKVVEIWCHARPETIGERYAARVGRRGEGHPGLEYVAELIALAGRAKPLGVFARLDVDCEARVSGVDLAGNVAALWDASIVTSPAPDRRDGAKK